MGAGDVAEVRQVRWSGAPASHLSVPCSSVLSSGVLSSCVLSSRVRFPSVRFPRVRFPSVQVSEGYVGSRYVGTLKEVDLDGKSALNPGARRANASTCARLRTSVSVSRVQRAVPARPWACERSRSRARRV